MCVFCIGLFCVCFGLWVNVVFFFFLILKINHRTYTLTELERYTCTLYMYIEVDPCDLTMVYFTSYIALYVLIL